MKKKFTFLMAVLLLMTFLQTPIGMLGQSKTETTTTYTFTSKSWAATSGGNAANWTSGLDGAGFSNNGIQVTTAATSANGTSPVSFTNVTKIVATYNTNKSKGAGTIEAQIGSNTAVTKNWAYSSGDGTSANYTVQWDYNTPQTGNVKITCNTTTNSIYLVSVAITTTSGGGSSATATTTTIDYSGITNTDVYVNTAAGSLSATVTPEGESALVSPTITWTSSNPSVATIDSDGVVTLVAKGETTITASYAGVANTYAASSATYILTVTSSAPDYAVLPFTWDGGTSSDLLALQGVTASGLGSDYAAANSPYLVKFDNTGDYITIKTDSRPGVVTIGVKMIGGGNTSTITVQGSADGETFTNIETLSISGSQDDELTLKTTNDFPDTHRYVKMLFTKGSNVGVGPISITNTVPTITVTSSLEAFSYIFGNGPSASQSFTVSGINLTDPLVVTASSNYEVCKTANGTYGSSVSYTLTSGSVATSTVYVRLKAGLEVGSYATADDKITVSSTGADSRTVSLSGSVAPVYSLTSAVSPAEGGTVTLGAASLATGYTTTATASANAGYKFTEWSISGTGASLSSTSTNPTTVTMGTANVTVTAIFEVVKTYAITYSVNGVKNTENVEENADIDFSTPSSALIPAGYVFKGWRESTLDPTNTDPDDYVTSATSTQNKTYYAVMAKLSHNDATWTLDYAIETALSSSTSWGGYGTAYNYTATDGGTWTVKAYKNSGMQINTGKDCSIKIPTCTGNIKSIAITCTAAKAVGFSTSDYSGSGTISYVVYGTDATSQTLDFTGKTNTEGYIVPRGGSTPITKIVVTYKVATYSNYCTTVSAVTMTEDVTIDGDLTVNYTLTVPTGKTLTVNGTIANDNPANLIIEDGGQISVSNTGVQATFQKSVTGFGSLSKEDENPYNDNYKLIAKPTVDDETNVLPANIGNMLTTNPNNYDLYKFDENENGAEWRNYKVSPFTINNGKGYLYANSEDVILNFAGEVPTAKTTTESGISLSYTSGNHFAGFNLIGNPFAVNITSMKINTTPCGYYKLENDGTFTSVPNVALNPVAVGQGFMVEAEANTDKLHLNPVSKDEESFSNESIRLEVANSEYTDVAYICFGNMMPLTKINHMNEEAPMIYIHNEKSDKAVAVYNNRGEVKSFNVNFVAKTTGRYTISGKMMNGEVKYMHLYDRLTGVDTDLLTDSYTFIGAKGDNAGRFILNLESVDNGSSTGSETFAWQSGSEIIVDGAGELQIFDVTGRKVMNAVVNGAHKVSGLNNGLYIFKLNGKTQKIIVR